jgi:hypothetical protein
MKIFAINRTAKVPGRITLLIVSIHTTKGDSESDVTMKNVLRYQNHCIVSNKSTHQILISTPSATLPPLTN